VVWRIKNGNSVIEVIKCIFLECKKIYKSKKLLDEHHNNPKCDGSLSKEYEHKCQMCSKGFYSMFNLQRHLKSQHYYTTKTREVNIISKTKDTDPTKNATNSIILNNITLNIINPKDTQNIS